MKTIKDILKPIKPLSIDELNAWQKENNIELPQEYAKFLLQFNGALGLTNEFRINFDLFIDDQSVLAVIEEFFPLSKLIEKKNQWKDKLEEFIVSFNLQKKNIETEHLLPIAEFVGGGIVLISIGGKHREKIYYCDEGDFGIMLLNDSINDFLDGLTIHFHKKSSK